MTDVVVNAIVRANARQLAQELTRTRGSLRGFGDDANAQGKRAQAGLSQAGKGADLAREQIQLATQALVGFFGIQAAARGLSALRARADGYANLTAKIKLASEGQSQYAAGEAEVFAISQRTSTALAATATLYSRIFSSLKDQGGSQSEVLALTETINQSFAVSGATVSEAGGAIQQLSQAFASGTLRGDEFNSVNEQAPRLMQALANSLKVTRGELRAMAEAGELTSDKLRQAFSGPEARKIAEEYSQLPLTIERSFTQLDNAFTRYVGQASEASGAGTFVAVSVQALSENFGALASGVGILAAVLGGRLVASLVAAGLAKAQLAVQTERLARAEAIESAAAQASIAVQLGKARALAGAGAATLAKISADNAAALAEGRATSVTQAATAAAAAKTIAVRTLSGALSLMGGPIGLVITGISLLIAKMISASAQAKQLKADIASAFADSESLLDDPGTPAKSFQGVLKQLEADRKQKQLERDGLRTQSDASRARFGNLPDQSAEIAEADLALANLDKRIKAVRNSMVERAVAEQLGTLTTQQASAANAAASKELQKLAEQQRIATIRATQGERPALIAIELKRTGAKSEKELSAATIAAIDAIVKDKKAEDAATESKKKGAKASRDAASETKKQATELKKLTEEQRRYRDETSQLQADAKGELFGADERTRQLIEQERRDGASAKRPDGDVRARVAAIAAEAQRAVNELVESGRIQLLESTGQTIEAATAQATQKYQATIDGLVAQGNEAGANIFRKLFDVDVAKAQLAQLQQQVDASFAALQRGEQSLQTQVQTGSLTDLEARQKLIDLYREHGATIDALLPKMEALALATGDPQSLERVRQVRAELEQLNATTSLVQQQLGQTFSGAASSAFEGLITQTKTLREAVAGFFSDMAAGLARMASQALAQAAFQKLLKLFGKDNSIGDGAAKLSEAALETTVAGGTIFAAATAMSAAATALALAGGGGWGGSAALFSGGGGGESGGSAGGGIFSSIASGLLSIFGSGGFDAGGFTGPGGKYQLAGAVHKGEYVLPQETVGFYGLDFLRALHMRRVPSFSVPRVRAPSPRHSFADGGFAGKAMSGGGTTRNDLRVYNHFDLDSLAQALATHPAIAKAIVVNASENGNAIKASWDN